jgi:MYXO-CTERM domain-containing protein
VDGRETGTLEFNSSAITEWMPLFMGNRAVQLLMDVDGLPGERLTVNLARVDETTAPPLALTKVLEAGGTPPDDGYGCSISGAPKNATGLGVLTVLGLIFLRRRRLAVRAR